MFFLSWFTALGSGMTSVCLVTDTDSPGYRMRYEKPHLETRPSPRPTPTLSKPLGLTCQDGLVHTKCGGLDLNEAEVSRHLVSHYTGRLAWVRMGLGPSPQQSQKDSKKQS